MMLKTSCGRCVTECRVFPSCRPLAQERFTQSSRPNGKLIVYDELCCMLTRKSVAPFVPEMAFEKPGFLKNPGF